MGSEAETVFRWKCPNCGKVLEESNQGSLMIAKLAHEKTCSPGPAALKSPEEKGAN